MSDLAGFLLARIAEDEEAAQKLTDSGRWSPHRDEAALTWEVHCDAWGHQVTTGYVGNCESRPMAEHIARFDPARVLAECDAKWRIVKEWQVWATSSSNDPADGARDAALEFAVQHLATVYADHPDFQQAWRP